MPRAPGGPRVRYMALRVNSAPGLQRRGLIQAIRETGRNLHGEDFEEQSGIWLTRYKAPDAIVRCHHTHQETVREVLEAVRSDPAGEELRLEPIATSGTIRTLVTRHVPRLKEPPNHLRRHDQSQAGGRDGGNGHPGRKAGRRS